MLTVGDLLRELDLEALTGEDGLDAPVRWVHISELLDPTPWLTGGEVLLTTGMQLEDAAAQRAFVGRLADHGLAGVGLGIGFAHARAPEELVAAARERRFPLFEVPYETPFIAVTEKAAGSIVSEHYAALRRSIAAQERLQQVVLSERGLDGIASTLSSLVGGAAVILDQRGGPLAQSGFQRPLAPEVLQLLGEAVAGRAGGDAEPFVPDHAELRSRSLALPVFPGSGADGPPEAWLVAAKDAGGLSEFDRLVLHQAVSVVALELLRRRIAASTERRLAGDILAEVLSRQLSGAKLARRLEPFGLGGQVTAVVAAAGGDVTEAGLEAAMSDAIEEEGVSGLVATDGELVAALLPGFLDEELFALAERVRERLGDVRVAAGRAVPTGDARRAYTEARCALEARALTGGRNGASPESGVATHRDLGSFALLLSLQESDALEQFCESVLGPIENGDTRHGEELMRSLSVFLDENGHWERAARRLYCHRHTLRYRMKKIEELTGRELARAGDRIELWLALRARELVS